MLELLALPGSASMWPPSLSLALALAGSLGRQLEVDAPIMSSSNGWSRIWIEEGKLRAAPGAPPMLLCC